MKPVLMIVLVLLLMAGCSGSSDSSGQTGANPPVPERITFAGGGELGIFDPSIARDPGSGRLWMSYSAVDDTAFYEPDVYWGVSIRLAFSDDSGDTWQDAGVEAAGFSEQIVGPMAATNPAPPINNPSAGVWQSETSSLIHDPGAPSTQRWKLIYFQYLDANLNSYFLDYSWIAMKTAATPAALAAATPVKLFGGFGLQADGENTGDPVYSPIGTPAAIQLNADLTQPPGGADVEELDFCVFAEPGLHATSTDLYLSMFCIDVAPPATEYLVAFRCESPCTMTDAAGWEYLGRITIPDDAADISHDHFQAPAMVSQNGKTYLLATPVETSPGNRYDGCRVYEFADVDAGALLTDGGGQLVEIEAVYGDPDTHHGACEALDGLQGGIIYSQFEPDGAPETFRMYKSRVSIP